MSLETLPTKDAMPLIIALIILAIAMCIAGSWNDEHPSYYQQMQEGK